MLGCCHCLCSKEYSALTCVESCYPNDGRADPVHARVRELINWGTHDIDRFSTIHEILADKIRLDIERKNDAGVTVGLKIMASLLQNVREINYNISVTMTTCITQLIDTKRLALLQIAATSTQDLISYTTHAQLSTQINRIINAYLNLLKDDQLKETVFESISTIVSHSTQLQWIPVQNILKSICPTYFSENSGRNIIQSMAHIVLPLSLNKLTNDLFTFFNERNLWNDEDFISSLLLLFFNEIPENCAPPFFKSWLEQLPPRSPEVGHSKSIISITVRLVEQVSPERIISQAQTDALTILYLFILNLPQLMYDDKASILDNSLVIESFLVSHIPIPELLKIAHRQIWEWLPTDAEKQIDYDHEKVGLIFRFASTFNEAAKKNLNKLMINDSLTKIRKFLISFKHDEIILGTVLEHMRAITTAYPQARLDSLINFLLDLQKEVKHKDNDLTLHTFIMSAFYDLSRDGPPLLKSYVQDICKQRIKANPPQVDLSLSFIVKQFPELKGVKPSGKANVQFYFKKKSVVQPRRMSSVIIHPQMNEQDDDLDIEEEEISEVVPAIPALVFQEEGEVSEASAKEPPAATFEEAVEKQKKASDEHKAFLNELQNINFEWKSNVPLPVSQTQEQ